MRPRCLLLLLALAVPVPAQADQGAVDAALRELAASKKGNVMAQRKAIEALGPLVDARISTALADELTKAARGPLFDVVVNAIGAAVRPEFAAQLRSLLFAADLNPQQRRVVAQAIGKQGRAGIDLLSGLARGTDSSGDAAVRDASLDGLAAAKDERAWRVLAGLLGTGGNPQQMRVLQLLDGVKDVAAVTKARVQLLRDNNLAMAVLAFRQLADEGNDRAARAAGELIDRAGDQPGDAVAADLVRGLAALQDPEFHAAVLRFGAVPGQQTRNAVKSAGAVLGKDATFVTWLARKGVAAGTPEEREVALLMLRAADRKIVDGLLVELRAKLAEPTPELLDLGIGLHEFLRTDPTWRTELLAMARHRDGRLRTAGLTLLGELQCTDALAVAQASLDAEGWELRSAAMRYLSRVRDVTSIPLLIERVGLESGRLEFELFDTLFVHCGRRFFTKPDWKSWWRENHKGFVLPMQDSVRNAGGGAGGGTVAYFNIPLVSHKFSFVIDVSGSMRARIGTAQNRTRLDEAKVQLKRVVEGLTENHQLNLIVFDTGARAAWERLRKADAVNKLDMVTQVEALTIRGATNVYAALELAFRDRDVDTIYLLTDGAPSAGEITDENDLADEVQRWNRTRQIVIHCISLGTDSRLLKRLAADSGGVYVRVR